MSVQKCGEDVLHKVDIWKTVGMYGGIPKRSAGEYEDLKGDSGGGVVRKVKGRVTLLGVIYEGTSCGSFPINETDHIANAAFYSDDICKYTGICSK